MYEKILIPVDLDHEELVPRKLELARRVLSPGGKITLMTVLENVPGYVSEFVTVKSENHLTDKVGAALRKLGGGAADIEIHVCTGKPGVEIAQHAADAGIEMVIVGSHRPGLRDYFLGSTAARVVRRAPCSVLVARP
ncbi:universal stress protein [Tropicimonas sp. S265A]|uniref:universal stress protein n=1 Tax=Tropicimonas sp. S265A TaxID=3415134 RepID=UPI003C7DCA7F